jgi:hypothetical protein
MKEIAALLLQIAIPECQYRILVTNLLTEVRGKAIIWVAFCESIVKENGVTAVCSMHQEMRSTKSSSLSQQTISDLDSLFLRFLDHTQTLTPSRTPLNEWSARRRGHYLHSTQQKQESNIHALTGTRNRDPSNRANSDLRLRTAQPPGS